ncbi:MAG: HEAT repeat domain-containing protein [bacterium]|nr:HEAT repeat domain-containing protein [bacterium]
MENDGAINQKIMGLIEDLKISDIENDDPAYTAMVALAEIGKPAVPALLGVLKGKADEYSRRRAAGILGDIEDLSAAPALLAVVKDEDDDYDVRVEAVIALGELGDKGAIGALVKLVQSEIKACNDVSELAGHSLEALVKSGEKSIPEIEGALKSNSPTVRRVLVGALKEIGEAALPALGRALESDYYNLPELAENALFHMDVDPRKAKAAAAKAPLKHEGPKPDFKVKPMGSRQMPRKQEKAPRRG